MSDRPAPAPQPLSLRGEHSEATRQALIASGRDAFGSGGYQEAGIEAVARAARVSRGALYHHFEDKKALFEAVVVTMQTEAAAEVKQRASAAKQPWAQLTAATEAMLEIGQRSAYRRIVLEDAPAVLGKQRCAEIDDAHAMGVLKERIAKLQASGHIAAVSASVLGALLGAMISEGAALLSAKSEETSPERVRAVVRTFLEAFRT